MPARGDSGKAGDIEDREAESLPVSDLMAKVLTHPHAEKQQMLGLRTRPEVRSYRNLRHILGVASVSFPVKWDPLMIALLTEAFKE